MRYKDAGLEVRNPTGGAEMSFEQIAEHLGCTRGGAWMAYKSGMNKLRRSGRLEQLRLLLELSKAKDNPPWTR